MRKFFLKILRSAIDAIVQEALESATKELNEEIDSQFKIKEAQTLKSGIEMLKQRVGVILRAKLEA